MSPDDLNIIFYGPPGTGKTYRTAERAVSLIDGSASTDRVEFMDRYEQLRESGQIDMVTFHQSMSYEEFVEGIRPTLGEDGDITYACEPGIFRRICQRAMLKTGATQSADLDYSILRVWKMSLGNTKKSGDTELFAECMQENRIALGYGGTVDFSDAGTRQQVEEAIRKRHDGKLPRSFAVTAVDTLKHRMQVGDLVIVSDGNHKYRAIGKITGGYEFVDRDGFCQTRPVEWLYRPEESEPREYILHNNFSQQSIYEIGPSSIKMEGLKERLSTDSSDAPRRHVLIIDEINRGNIAKILGELMTLLEASKRLGAPDERRVTLPYSKADFGVPPNLFVIGTMNTADRSIALLDTALRRRFRFHEMMPDCEVVRDHAAEFEALAEVDLAGLVELMNKRIEVLYDRDHMLGHAFFFKATNLVSLRDLFVAELIPMLQDYFCDNWAKVGLVLGASFAVSSSASDSEILEADQHDMSTLFGQADVGFEAAPRISVSKAFEAAEEEELLPFFQGIWA